MSRRQKRHRIPEQVEAATTQHQIPVGGGFRPLDDQGRDAIIDAAFDILARVGLADAPPWLADLLIHAGASQRPDGRLTFGRKQVEAALQRAASTVALPGYIEKRGLDIGGGRVHIGTVVLPFRCWKPIAMRLTPAVIGTRSWMISMV